MRILVVEDEKKVASFIRRGLEAERWEVEVVHDGPTGLSRARSGDVDLVVLDVMLPGMSGFEVCRALRARRPEQAILMLTARGAEADVLEGFRCGADDYVTKPFSVAELMARIDALLRRAGPPAPPPEPFEFAAWRVDPATRTAVCGAGTVALSGREIALLALFARDAGRIVSRRRLLVEVWGLRHVERIHTRTVDVHIAKLRKKIEAPGTGVIETVRGEGYRFTGVAGGREH